MSPGRKNKKIPGIGRPNLILNALKVLADSKARYLVVGGVAMNLHGIARATKDIDLLIPKDLKNTQKILTSLENLTFGISKEILAEEVVAKPFTIIGDSPRVDLLLRAGKLKFEDAYPNRKQRTIDNIKIPYLSEDDMIRSKQTDRERDLLEIKELKQLKKIKQK